MPFNRTNLELKQMPRDYQSVTFKEYSDLMTFNRTNLELKQVDF